MTESAYLMAPDEKEVDTSRRTPDRYHVYRLYEFRRDPRFFALQGAIDSVVALEPTEFRARLR